MGILLRVAAVVGLWLFTKGHRNEPSAETPDLSSLSWPQRTRFIWRVSRDKRLPIAARALVWLPAIYIVSPIDIIPDFIPVLGRLDDALVYSLVADLLVRFTPATILQEHMAAVRARAA